MQCFQGFASRRLAAEEQFHERRYLFVCWFRPLANTDPLCVQSLFIETGQSEERNALRRRPLALNLRAVAGCAGNIEILHLPESGGRIGNVAVLTRTRRFLFHHSEIVLEVRVMIEDDSGAPAVRITGKFRVAVLKACKLNRMAGLALRVRKTF